MVHELLSRGKENAKTSEELIKAGHFSNKRELTMQISRERDAGVIICSTTSGRGGYYLPASREEIQNFVNSMSKRAKNTFRAVKNAKRLLREVQGQLKMNGSEKE